MDLQTIFTDWEKIGAQNAVPYHTPPTPTPLPNTFEPSSSAYSQEAVAISSVMRDVPLQFDLPRALRALQLITKKYPLTQGCRQLSLTHAEADPAKQTVADGIGSLFDYDKNSWKAREADFPHFSTEFQGSYFHQIYLKTQEWTGGKIGRARIMYLPPRACYSMHRDPTIRFHLALITNPQAFLVFREGQLVHVPADGQLYALDTRREHTAMNCSLEDRIHFVLSLREDKN